MPFILSTEDRLKAAMGLPAWMQRRKRLERRMDRLRQELRMEWEVTSPSDWIELAKAWDLKILNEEIIEYNAYYPIERQLPMDPSLRDFVELGKRWRPLPLVDADWIMAEFPPRGAGLQRR